MYVENEPFMKMNAAVLNDLPGELYTIKANDKISDSFKYLYIPNSSCSKSKANKNVKFSQFA